MDYRTPTGGFLSLIPTTSSSYPQQPSKAEQTVADAPAPQRRRTSSVSTEASAAAASRRFLKLGPVHWGEHLDEHKEDWHAVE